MKIGERVRNSVRGREAMAGCRGAALTRVFDAGACAVLQMHILSRNGHRKQQNRAARPELNLD